MTKSDDLIHLSTGVVLRAVAAPVWLIQDAAGRVPKPRVPVRMNVDKGYEEAEEKDPAYMEALTKYNLEIASAANDTMLLLGTEIVEIPDGFEKPADDGWIEVIKSLGFDVGAMNRKLAWLKYWAVRSGADVTKTITAVSRKTGVREEDVADAVTSFRGREERLADRGPDAPATSPNGDNVSRLPAGRRSRVRGA